jgi:hypothetical protein
LKHHKEIPEHPNSKWRRKGKETKVKKNRTPDLARKMKGKKVSKEHDRKGPGRPKQMALTTFSCPRVKIKKYTHYARNIGIEGEPNQDVKWNKRVI